jgi:hypothetical protein
MEEAEGEVDVADYKEQVLPLDSVFGQYSVLKAILEKLPIRDLLASSAVRQLKAYTFVHENVSSEKNQLSI